MNINKQVVSRLATETISRLIADGIQVAWSSGYQIRVIDGEDSILMQVELEEIEQFGARLTINHGNDVLAAIYVRDCRMFSRAEYKEELDKWKENTHKTLVHNYSTWLGHKFCLTNPAFLYWVTKLPSSKVPLSITISDILFKGRVALNAACLQIEDNGTVVYRTERLNHINMTTQQGWQGMNANTIKSEARRIISTFLTNRKEFSISVTL